MQYTWKKKGREYPRQSSRTGKVNRNSKPASWWYLVFVLFWAVNTYHIYRFLYRFIYSQSRGSNFALQVEKLSNQPISKKKVNRKGKVIWRQKRNRVGDKVFSCELNKLHSNTRTSAEPICDMHNRAMYITLNIINIQYVHARYSEHPHKLYNPRTSWKAVSKGA